MWAVLLVLWFTSAAPSQGTNPDDSVRQAYQTGDQALQAGDLSKARQSFLQVLNLVPNDVGARVNLGVIYMRQQDWRHALEYLKEAEKRAPQVAGIRLNIGLAEYRQGNYAAATPPLESVLHDNPDSVQARHLLGLCYLFQEKYADAASTLEPLWASLNGDLSYLYSLAVASGNAGQHDWEERALTQLLTIGKDSPLLHLLRGKAYLAHEDFDRALEEFRVAAQSDPKLPLVGYNLGVVYRRRGQLDKAREEFLTDIASEPAVAFNYDQLGAIAYQLQQDRAAETYFRDALKRDPRLGTSWFGLAKIFKQEGRYKEALAALQEALNIDPQSASAHYLRAQVLSALGRKEEAKTELTTVRRVKDASRDKLEQDFEGAHYRDPQVGTQLSQ